MIDKTFFDQKADLIIAPEARAAAKHAVYHGLNRELQWAARNVKYVEVHDKRSSILIEVNKELVEAGYASMLYLNENDELVLRLYVNDKVA